MRWLVQELAARLEAIPHLKRLRVHTRMPVVLPERVDEALLGWLGASRLRPVLVIHTNHPREIDDDVIAAMARLSGAGVLLLNQAVLLRGVNDREDTLRELSERCFEAGVLPYYLHLLDPVAGAAHFDVPDVIRHVDVKEAPPGGPLGAYYVPPSEDFSRRGAICYQLAGDGPYPLWDEVSTAYHEGFPGHHLQCGLQVSFTESLCRLHRVAYGYSGFAEGWALYVEQLMSELGYYDKPDYELGMLANQMMRACRVVIDIGAHLSLPIPDGACFRPGERWTYDVAVEMMERLGGMEHDTALSEVTRYFGWPGQAISYKVGQRAMLALREEHQRAKLGDLKDFHARVLACGNVSLDLLRGEVLGS